MHKDKINRRIMKTLGWKVAKETEDGALMCWRTIPGVKEKVWDMAPDFTEDQNAIHAAVMMQHHNFHAGYAEVLRSTLGGVPGCFNHLHADALQRCLAYLATFEIWDEKERKITLSRAEIQEKFKP